MSEHESIADVRKRSWKTRHEKYGEQSFQHRRLIGDVSRGELDRTKPEVIGQHVRAHYEMHLAGIPHDNFNTRRHQLAAVAFNAMMEFYFAGLEAEANHE